MIVLASTRVVVYFHGCRGSSTTLSVEHQPVEQRAGAVLLEQFRAHVLDFCGDDYALFLITRRCRHWYLTVVACGERDLLVEAVELRAILRRR